jgi:acetyl-CoA carboxylase carboxyl transferase subunit alpha
VEEPPGGAHQDYDQAARVLDQVLYEELNALSGLSPDELREDRYQRFRKLGSFIA